MSLLAECEIYSAICSQNASSLRSLKMGVAVNGDAQARVARALSMVIGRASPDARERIPTDPGMRLAVRFLN